MCTVSDTYKTANDNYVKKQPNYDHIVPPNLNFAFLCKTMRNFKCDQIYDQIVPLLYKAALEGKPYITIDATVVDIHPIADILAKKLIKNHGINKLTIGPKECQIEFIPSERMFRYEYTNEQHWHSRHRNIFSKTICITRKT